MHSDVRVDIERARADIELPQAAPPRAGLRTRPNTTVRSPNTPVHRRASRCSRRTHPMHGHNITDHRLEQQIKKSPTQVLFRCTWSADLHHLRRCLPIRAPVRPVSCHTHPEEVTQARPTPSGCVAHREFEVHSGPDPALRWPSSPRRPTRRCLLVAGDTESGVLDGPVGLPGGPLPPTGGPTAPRAYRSPPVGR